ncbi:DUF397 domain-containing protein [Streptomyces sp. NPDC020607]|uniref:DUF397 domain-containing protein n=1 Tax=Streptomyces sp. NPDC020607 TaxID=3365082 RepID=UPI0037BB4587
MIRKASAQGVPEPTWFKSSYSSDGNEGDCVEVAHTCGAVRVRDSKSAQGPHLAVGNAAWSTFVRYASGS